MRIAIIMSKMTDANHVRYLLETNFDYDVIWIANNDLEGIKKCATETPDLVLMDLNLPIGGVEVTRRIMQNSPCAILLITDNIAETAPLVFQAMGHGALDVVRLPLMENGKSSSKGATELLNKIALIYRLIGKNSNGIKGGKIAKSTDEGESFPPLVILGASTGGPLAISKIISQFPPDFPAAVIIIQHVDKQFAPQLVHWFAKNSILPVEMAKDNSRPRKGHIYVAGTNNHLVIASNLMLKYTNLPEESIYRPSVDIFFASAAKYWPVKSVAVLLTGMSRDGAQGLKILRSKGWYTIAEHEASCVVYGMPKAAVELDAAADVLTVENIPHAIMTHLNKVYR